MLAARLLGLQVAGAPQAGYDAVGIDGRRVRISSRCVLPNSKLIQRLGFIRLDHRCDTVALILMDQNFEPLVIYEANRAAVERELLRSGSRSRNKRGALSVSKFKAISELRWSCDDESPAWQGDADGRPLRGRRRSPWRCAAIERVSKSIALWGEDDR